jgi:gluconate 2-dehydrogenase gamma chain
MAGKKKDRQKAKGSAGAETESTPGAATPPASPTPPPPGAEQPEASRRRFLKLAGVGALAAGAAGVWYAQKHSGGDGHDHDAHDAGVSDGGERAAPAPLPRPAQLVTFNPHQYDTLDAVAGVLLPADDQDPGARETGAMIYIDRAMGNPAFAGGARTMKVAVAAIDWQAGRTNGGKKFVELAFADQEAVIQSVYQGQADRGTGRSSFKGRTFVTLMLSLVLEGHLSEPVHGGNKDGMGWKLVAFEPVDPRPGRPMPAGGHGHH